MLRFHWFLPTYGDSRALIAGGHGSAMTGDRPASVQYLTQVAHAAETNGFEAVLTPTGAWCEDAWLTTAMLIESTEYLKFLVAFRPGLVSPTLAAQMATTFQRHSNGRLYLNVVTGGEDHEQRAYGDFLNKSERYERTGEFLSVVRRLWSEQAPFTFRGQHLSVSDASLGRRPVVVPPIFFGGSSAPAGDVAARFADVYLTWGEPPLEVGKKIAWINALAAEQGRRVEHGIRLHVISRDTSAEAWAVADKLLANLDPREINRIQTNLAQSQSEGQRRMQELHKGRTDALTIAPNLWAGVGLVRGGAGTALVGSHEEVADRIQEYGDLGISHFIFSGYPHIEEAYWFGEGVLPRLHERGLWKHPHRLAEAEQLEGAAVPFSS
ncbi:LLM class flavin-dependent oxidoreductase [Hoyosella rhizosphaerae]|uniref:Alkanesulfonate monooxygenase n=1 Tax=Hoyosella rhizosphaerae TaxID=1755582 RepID=A0A916U080_9ACTN|nr:LLM class flavin-dependent oxidoreductase [Hoyosella rhizosphaerae]MBN4927237.1 LLM class flavin-dependent oxidoreductase [Hoyosella rhizosphaerae]GGC52862.1 alkanesulfonate monooxygenase [Hoyosella rhizosphaerae]